MRRYVAWSLAAVLAVAGCSLTSTAARPPGASGEPAPEATTGGDAAAATEPQAVRLVTLGDGYTYGTGTDLPPRDGWPAQLADVLRRSGHRVYLFNLAETSSSSTSVREDQLGQVEAYEPDVVTVQVGTNDILGNETDAYRANVTAILEALLEFLPPERILAITTPDHTLTEWGKAYGPPEAVDALNETLIEVAGGLGITVIDIGPIYDLVTTNPSLLVQSSRPVPDPSAKQYAGWAEVIGLHVRDALRFAAP